MKNLLLLCALLVTTTVKVQSKPAEDVQLFKEIAKEAFKGGIVVDRLTEIAEEDCKEVCPPSKEGDAGAHLIRCVQCIAEELGIPVFPEFLESVLVLRSPELVEGDELEEEESESFNEEHESESSPKDESAEVTENLDILGLDEFQLLEQLSESFEEESVSIFTALLGQ